MYTWERRLKNRSNNTSFPKNGYIAIVMKIFFLFCLKTFLLPHLQGKNKFLVSVKEQVIEDLRDEN